jgi:N-acetylglucosaminyldiphosphoundecaprenol N-acetyl-beta-D-mannosaminyltransferase
LLQAIEQLDSWIVNNQRSYVCVTPVHALMDLRKEPNLRRIAYNSALTTPDGMPIVWLLKAVGHKHVSRVYGPDLMLAVCQHGLSRNYRHFLYGSTPETLVMLSQRLQQKFPNIQITGSFAPPFRSLTNDEDQDVIHRINQSAADIVWVGIGSPKQERWMAEHIYKTNAKVMLGVGAAFDFHAGTKQQAPRWMQRSGLEWFFRLLSEPGRLWKRYLISNTMFIFLTFLQITGLKKFPKENNQD